MFSGNSSTDFFLNDSDLETIYASSLNSMSKICRLCEDLKKPPNLMFLAGNDLQLQALAKDLHSLFTQKDVISFTAQDLSFLETATCLFGYKILQSVSVEEEKPKVQFSDKNEALSQNTEAEINSLKERLEESRKNEISLRAKLSDAEQRCESLNSDKMELLEQIEGDENYKRDILSRMNQINLEKDQTIAKLQNEVDESKQILNAHKGKTYQNDFAYRRLNDKYEDLGAENTMLNSFLTRAKLKLVSKSKKLQNLREQVIGFEQEKKKLEADNQKLLVITNEYRNRLVKALAQINAMSIDTSADESKAIISKQETAFDKLEKAFTAQQAQLQETVENQQKALRLIKKLSDCNEMFKAKLESMYSEKERKEKEEERLNSVVEEMKERLNQLEEEKEMLAKKALRADELDEVEKVVERNNGETTVDAIKRLNESTKAEDVIKMNERLISLLESHMKTMFDNLSNDTEGDLQDNITKEMKKAEKIIKENKTNKRKVSAQTSEDIIKKLINSNLIESKEVVSVLSAQVEATALLRKRFEETMEKLEVAQVRIKNIAKSVKYIGDESELEDFIAENFSENEVMTKKIMNILNLIECDHPLQEIFDSVIEMKGINQQFNKSVREAVGFSGLLTELPQAICNYISDLKEEVRNNGRGKGLIDSAIVFGAQSEAEFNTVLIDSYKNDLEQMQNKMSQLQKENDDIEQENEELQKTIAEKDKEISVYIEKSSLITQIKEDLRKDDGHLEEENERLKKMLDDLSSEYKKKTDELEESMKQERQEMKARFERTLNLQVGKLESSLEAKKTKLSQLKKKFNEVVNNYEEAFRQQKEAYSAARKQNIMLTQTVEQLQNQIATDPVKKNEIKEMKNIIKTKDVEKKLLQNTINQLKQQSVNIKEGMEEYCKSQLLTQKQNMIEKSNELLNAEREKYNKFVEKLSQTLSDDNSINDDEIIEEIIRLKETVKENAEKEAIVEQSSSVSLISQNELSTSKTAELLAKRSQMLKEWDRWGRRILFNVYNGLTARRSAQEMREALEELITASDDNKKLLKKIEMLRTQKKFMKAGVKNEATKLNERSDRVTMQELLIASLFIKRISKP